MLFINSIITRLMCPAFTFVYYCWQNLGPHANVGFSKAMSAGWLLVDKSAEGGPRVKRKVRKELQSLKGLCHGSPVHFG